MGSCMAAAFSDSFVRSCWATRCGSAPARRYTQEAEENCRPQAATHASFTRNTLLSVEASPATLAAHLRCWQTCTVQLVDECQARDVVAPHLAVHSDRLALHAADAAQHQDGAVQHPQRPLDLRATPIKVESGLGLQLGQN